MLLLGIIALYQLGLSSCCPCESSTPISYSSYQSTYNQYQYPYESYVAGYYYPQVYEATPVMYTYSEQSAYAPPYEFPGSERSTCVPGLSGSRQTCSSKKTCNNNSKCKCRNEEPDRRISECSTYTISESRYSDCDCNKYNSYEDEVYYESPTIYIVESDGCSCKKSKGRYEDRSRECGRCRERSRCDDCKRSRDSGYGCKSKCECFCVCRD